jgi:hypothetical protein
MPDGGAADTRVRHVQLVHPPWFDGDFDELGAAYFRSQGFDAAVTRGTGLPVDPARVDPPIIIEWVEQHVEDRAEAIFLAGNGFRGAGAAEELELRMGRLVIEVNQALLLGILRATGTGWDIPGHSAASRKRLDDVGPPVHDDRRARRRGAGGTSFAANVAGAASSQAASKIPGRLLVYDKCYSSRYRLGQSHARLRMALSACLRE